MNKHKNKLTLLLFFSFIISSGFLIGCSQPKDYLPNSFFDLKMTSKLEGEAAKRFVNNLHHQPVTVEKNEVGFYRAQKGEAIIYVTYYPSAKLAQENFDKMTEKITPEISPFHSYEFFELEGKRIYKTLGMGQTHYVFVDDKNLLWVTAENEWALKFLENYLLLIK